MDDKRLVSIKTDYDKLKIELAIAQKELNAATKILKKDFKIEDFTTIDAVLEELDSEIKALEGKRSEKCTVIEKKLSEYR